MQHPNSELSRPKSRDLSLLDYFETLQIEWICADLRRRIYPKIKDKNYWTRVATGKRDTIERLAEKNKLFSIFDDENMLRKFEKEVYKENSFPEFVYKDENNKTEQKFWDLHSYLYINSNVRVMIAGETKIGKITRSFTPYKDVNVYVTIDGVEAHYSTSAVTRIF